MSMEFQSKRFLVVDDNPDSRRTSAGILSDEGAEVVEAASAQEALNLMVGFNFHLVLCDGLDGEWLRVLNSTSATTLFLLYSGDSDELKKARTLGVSLVPKFEFGAAPLIAAIKILLTN